MTNLEITEQLLKIVSSDDFASSSAELTEGWSTDGVGVECIDTILVFMEAHPDLNYGMPGALVHFIERYYQKGYEERLIQSIIRKPTPHTVWMLNRIINGTREPTTKGRLISTLRQAASHPKIDQSTLECINSFLQRLNS